MQTKLQEVLEKGRKLSFEERVVAARELLMPEEDELSERDLRRLEAEMAQRDSLIPYDEVRRELGLASHTPRAKAARRR